MELSEKAIIERIRSSSGSAGGELLVAIGDDCAVLKRTGNMLELLTIDTLVEEIHFNSVWHAPLLLGRKAAAVNISDIAAMGGMPRYALLSLALPGDFKKEWLDDFMKGFLACLADYDTELIGGDTVGSSGGITISVTLLGEVSETELLRRSTARAGDLVVVSDFLGEAAAGLELCRNGYHDKGDGGGGWQRLLAAHLDPEPEVALGRLLAASGRVTAMMDLSDGLATDLAHLCMESGVGAEVEASSLPITDKLQIAAELLDGDPFEWALRGGEDYRLLFTVAEGHFEELNDQVRSEIGRTLHVVGKVVDGSGVTLLEGAKRRDISYTGYDHFK